MTVVGYVLHMQDNVFPTLIHVAAWCWIVTDTMLSIRSYETSHPRQPRFSIVNAQKGASHFIQKHWDMCAICNSGQRLLYNSISPQSVSPRSWYKHNHFWGYCLNSTNDVKTPFVWLAETLAVNNKEIYGHRHLSREEKAKLSYI